jgi:hypothetical protein
MKNYLSYIVATITLFFFFQSTDSIAKPSVKKPVTNSNTTSMGNGIRFTFQGCTQISNQEKVVCEGIFRSSNGERSFSLSRDDQNVQTKITDSTGKTYVANEIQVGGDYNCKELELLTSCYSSNITLVEGADYKAIFTFTNVSLPLPKISLFSIGYSDYTQSYYIKYRNVLVR